MINKSEILEIAPQALFDEPMKNHTTFRIGGNADCFISAKNILSLPLSYLPILIARKTALIL